MDSTKRLLKGVGTITSSANTWTVELLAVDPGLRITRRWGGVEVSESPTGWQTHDGAFVYIDEQDRVWAFDGRQQSYIHESKAANSAISWDFRTWNGEFPPIVKQHLPAEHESEKQEETKP